MTSNSRLVSESVFFWIFCRFLSNFGPNLDPNLGEFCCRKRVRKRFRTPSGERLFVIDFGPSNDQKCDLASTKCTLMSVLNVENQDFCNAFSNFLTFFQSKRTSRCPKLVPNDYFCSRGDPFFIGLGEVSLSCRNP